MDLQCLVAPGPASAPGVPRTTQKSLLPYAVRRGVSPKRLRLSVLEPSWRNRAAADSQEGATLDDRCPLEHVHKIPVQANPVFGIASTGFLP